MERDKFLTEAMGECWHKTSAGMGCERCGLDFVDVRGLQALHNNFSTWQGFGKLLNVMCDNKDVGIIVTQQLLVRVLEQSMDNIPDRFADAVYEFLNGR